MQSPMSQMNPNTLTFLKRQFNQQYDGFPASIHTNSAEHNNVVSALRRAGLSFRTKIVKKKRTGRKFVIQLLEPFDAP